jgi:hypothetical protein
LIHDAVGSVPERIVLYISAVDIGHAAVVATAYIRVGGRIRQIQQPAYKATRENLTPR